MPNVKTIELSGTETAVRFGENYPYFWVWNYGSGDVYMSLSPGIAHDADGVIRIPARSGRSSGDVGQANVLYFIGSGKIEITPQHNAVCPFFKPAAKGGESSFSGDYNDLANKPDIPVPSEVIDSNSTNETVSTSRAVFDYVTMLASAGFNPVQIKKDAVVSYAGKTVAEFKSALLNWWDSAGGTLSVYRFSGGNTAWWLENFKNDDEIISVGNTYQIIPIVDYSPQKIYATFLFSTVANSAESYSILKLELYGGKFTYLSRLIDLSGYARKDDKQDILTKPELTGAVDWDTLTETAIYPIGIANNLSDSYTHGLDGVYGYGVLIITSKSNRNVCYQIYINDSHEVYQRSKYNSWRAWKRIDAGVGVTLTKPAISDPTTDWNTITETGFYTIGYDGLIKADSHGPLGVTGWGLLSVINTGLGSTSPACIRQIYEAGSAGLYTRNKRRINGEWSPWYVYRCETYTPS